MALIVLSIHLVVCIALIGLVLLQRSEGGALGIGGGGGALMSGRGAADALANMTKFAGGFFLVTSLSLTVISGAARDSQGRSVFDVLPSFQGPPAPAPAPATEEPSPPTIPDPTQSSAPQAATTELASLQAAPAQPAITLGPASASAAERAGPIAGSTGAARVAVSAPRAVPPPATPPALRDGEAAQPAATTTQPRTQPLQLPGSARAAAALGQQTGASGPESVEAEPEVVAVRRQRAGPDQ